MDEAAKNGVERENMEKELRTACHAPVANLDMVIKASLLCWKTVASGSVVLKQKAEEEKASAEVKMLRSKSFAAEARLAAAQEKVQYAQKEAEEWKRKYAIANKEVKNTLETAAAVQERTNHQTQSSEAAQRTEFFSLTEKENEMKEKTKD